MYSFISKVVTFINCFGMCKMSKSDTQKETEVVYVPFNRTE